MTQPTPTPNRPDANDGANIQAEEAAVLTPDRPADLPGQSLLYLRPGRHVRAGFTKSHSQGTPKAKRRMAKASRKRNRGK